MTIAELIDSQNGFDIITEKIKTTSKQKLYFVFPPLFSEGYNSVKLVANRIFNQIEDNTALFSLMNADWALVVFTALIVLVKPIAAAITIHILVGIQNSRGFFYHRLYRYFIKLIWLK